MITQKSLLTLPNGKYRIETNLYLRVQNNSRFFLFLYSFAGVRRELSLGSVSNISLSVAKVQASKCRLLIAQGIDPKAIREENKAKIQSEKLKQTTFAEYYEQILPKILQAKHFKSPTSEAPYKKGVYIHVIPFLGKMQINSITTQDIVHCLERIWFTKTATAHQMRIVLELVFNYAKKEGLYQGDNPATFRFNLDMYLPPITRVHQPVHRRYAENDELIHLLKLLAVWHWWYPKALTPLMIMLTCLLACRANESSDLAWSEINMDNKIITLPVERKKFKKGEPFVIPLSKQSIWILNEIKKIQSEDFEYKYVFQHPSGARLHRSNVRKHVIKFPTCLHGFRSSFRNWCSRNHVNHDVAESCLMHAVGRSETERSYLRDDFLDLRTDVLQRWADFVLPMETLTAEFLTDQQKATLKSIPRNIQDSGWKGLLADKWNLGL